MSTTIESLQLEITASSQSAESGLDKLAKSLEAIKSATKDGLGLDKVAKELNSFSKNAQNATKNTNKLSKANKDTSLSFLDMAGKVGTAIAPLKKVANVIKSCVEKSTKYTESVHLFDVAMGGSASTAKDYADQVGAALGIDPGEWMENQGIFNTLATGFGVTGDRAATMSTQLTQLGYDLASFYNMDVEDAMTKLQSGLAGELEPLRRLGYDLSQAKLEATAFALGIDKSVSSMTQAEKAQLRYYAIMEQVTTTHGDMADTIDSPANQLRVLKSQFEQTARAIGNVFIPMLNAILPYGIAMLKVIRSIADGLAALAGYKAPELGKTGVDDLASGADDASGSLEDASKEAKKLKSYMMGFDELNVIAPDAGEGDGEAASQFEFELPTYDFIDSEVSSRADELVNKCKAILEVAGLVGGAFALWAIPKAITDGLEKAYGILDKFNLDFGDFTLGGIMLLDDLKKMVEYLEDINDKGPTLENVTGLLSTFAGSIGDVMVMLGKTKTGAALIAVESVLGIVSAIASMATEGVNVDNVTDLIYSMAGIGTAIGFFTKNTVVTGVSLVVQGLTGIINELATNWEAIKQGDWSGVDKVALVIGAIEVIGGVVYALDLFNKIKGATKTAETVKNITDVGDTVTGVNTGTSVLNGKLTSLIGTLALGAAIVGIVSATAIIFVGAIWVIGEELGAIAVAWTPVIENGGTVITALALGSVTLGLVGLGAAGLGTLGTAMVGQIALGAAMLVLVGAGAILFIAEITLLGETLNELYLAWLPLNGQGGEIAAAIATGTALLIGIGVVVAALGVATVASAGLLPVAIGLGTGMLLALSGAFKLFIDQLVDVANKLSDELHPALESASGILPALTDEMDQFTKFMGTFAGKVVSYSINSAVAGISGTISKIIGFFTGDPIKRMTKEVSKQGDQFDDLLKDLRETIPKIKEAIKLTNEYNTAMSDYANVSGGNGGAGKGSGGILGTIVGGIAGIFGRAVGVPAFASGGYPTEGQIFLANENGPELVGTIGNRTAVANNDQIVAGIADGVAEANDAQNELLREQNALLRLLLEKDTATYLDGRSLTNSVEKYQRQRGKVLITGGVI